MNDILAFLQQRNSAPRLTEPAPDSAELAELMRAAGRAPDHAWLRPWRFLAVRDERRAALGELFLDALRARNPDADAVACDKARQAPLRAPLVLVVIAGITEHPKVPAVEQRLSAGCAAHAVLLAAEALGYAGIWRTGDAAFDPAVAAGLGLTENEEIIGFLYLGSRDGRPKTLPALAPDTILSDW